MPDTEGCFLVPAFTGLGSPWWDPYARGTIVGITRGTGRGHLARAVLESISLQTRDVVHAMSEASGHPIRALKADGGAAANDLLLQLQADDLQVPVSRPVVQETTALGAAYLAGLAEGVWSCHRRDHGELAPRSPPSTPQVDEGDLDAATPPGGGLSTGLGRGPPDLIDAVARAVGVVGYRFPAMASDGAHAAGRLAPGDHRDAAERGTTAWVWAHGSRRWG